MKLKEILKSYSDKYSHRGYFDLNPGESINDAVRHHDIPREYGVYIVTAHRGNTKEVIYIGKAGTLQQNGEFKKQTLRKRLTMKQNGEYRRNFFIRIMNENDYDKLTLKWFITYNEYIKVLPALAEAELIQTYWQDNQSLPILNKSI